MVRKWIKDNETINTHITTAYLSSAVTKFGLDFFQKSQDTVLIWAKKGWEISELDQLSRSALEHFQLSILGGEARSDKQQKTTGSHYPRIE